MKLEYETLVSPEMYVKSLASYEIGRSLSFEYITMFKKTVWGKNTTVINEDINLPRKSLKSIASYVI